MMPSMIGFEFGEIVLVRFPFTDQRGSKQRPAVVVSSSAYNRTKPDVILMAVISRIRQELAFGEAVIDGWKTAKLLKPSAITPVVFTIEQQLVARTLGSLMQEDQAKLRETISKIVG